MGSNDSSSLRKLLAASWLPCSPSLSRWSHRLSDSMYSAIMGSREISYSTLSVSPRRAVPWLLACLHRRRKELWLSICVDARSYTALQESTRPSIPLGPAKSRM